MSLADWLRLAGEEKLTKKKVITTTLSSDDKSEKVMTNQSEQVMTFQTDKPEKTNSSGFDRFKNRKPLDGKPINHNWNR